MPTTIADVQSQLDSVASSLETLMAEFSQIIENPDVIDGGGYVSPTTPPQFSNFIKVVQTIEQQIPGNLTPTTLAFSKDKQPFRP